MTKLEQMDELIQRFQKDEALQKEIAVVLQAEDPEDTTKADQWLADNGYEFTIRELVEHLEDGIPMSDEQLEAVAGGKDRELTSGEKVAQGFIIVGVGFLSGALACALFT